MRRIAVWLVILAVMLCFTVTATEQKPIASTKLGLYNAPKGFFTQTYTVKKGEIIQITVEIRVDSASPVPLNGFWIYVTLNKPDGSTVDTWVDFTGETVNIGEAKTFLVNTGIQADQVGTWGAWVMLCMEKDTSTYISFDSTGFDVVEEPQYPQAWITITDVAGVSVVGASLGTLAAAIYVLSRF